MMSCCALGVCAPLRNSDRTTEEWRTMKARRTSASASACRPRSQWSMYTLVSSMAQATLRFLEATGVERSARPRHETPEILHLRYTLEREADRLRLRADPQGLLRPAHHARIHKKRLALQCWCSHRPSGDPITTSIPFSTLRHTCAL